MEHNRVYHAAISAMENDNYDMNTVFSAHAVATACETIFRKLRTNDVITTRLGGYSVKVQNAKQGSWLSMSNEDGTAVSRTLASILDTQTTVSTDEIENLIEMLNEAWYKLNKD